MKSVFCEIFMQVRHQKSEKLVKNTILATMKM